ncbi:MAG: membrane-bound lytic murein transglycosylase MltF [Gammaproteobacteria bacterium]
MNKALIILLAALVGTCSRPPSLLDEVRDLGHLRMATLTSPTSYYIGAGGPEGPEYDLANGFAMFLCVDLEVKELSHINELVPAVEDGRAHIGAAGLSITPERAERVDFGPTYDTVKEHLVYKLGTGKPRKLTDVRGKRFEVASGTSYMDTLSEIQTEEESLTWAENPQADAAELLEAVQSQQIDYTVVDSNIFDIHRHYLPDIRIALDLEASNLLAWALPRRYDDSLAKEAERYFEYVRRSGELTRIKERYYGHRSDFDYVGTRTFIRHKNQRLPRYRQAFENAGREFGVDWKLLAAIGYQESHWNPMAVSPTVVRGLMMLTRKTAAVMGVSDRVDPKQSIVGGSEYFSRISQRLSPDIREPDRTWFALAAYNVGYGHVLDARSIARMQRLDANSWLSIKKTLPLLAQKRWHTKVPRGYARGWEPVQYVENVRKYYDTMKWLVAEDEAKFESEGNVPDIQTAFGTDAKKPL